MNSYFKKKNELSPFDESSSLRDFFQMPFFKSDEMLKTDVIEEQDSYRLVMDVPGCNKDDVKISNNDGYLTIDVTKNHSYQNTSGNYIKKERMHGNYSRSYYIGNSIDSKDIKANYSNGILEITFPKEKTSSSTSYVEITEN